MSMISLLFGIIVVLIIVKYWNFKKNRRRFEHLINQFPGPKTYPFIGNAPFFFGTTKDIIKRINLLAEDENPYRLWILNQAWLLIFDPENFQILANKVLHKNFGYHFAKDVIGNGLITSTGERWKKHRRILNPAFNLRLLLDRFWNTFRNLNDQLVHLLEEECEKGRDFDLWPYIINYTMNSIIENALDYKDNLKKGGNSYGHAILRLSHVISIRTIKPWWHPNIIYNLYKKFKGYDEDQQHIRSLPKLLIERKRREIDFFQKSNPMQDYAKTNKTFIDILLTDSKNKLKLSDDELVDETINFIMAGSETTALTLCAVLLMLAIHQNHQETVYQEIENILGDIDDISVDDLKRLIFLEQCINETLRAFPPVPIVFRDTTEDVELKNGQIVPAGTTIALFINLVHHNSKIYPNPYEWNPDNFSTEAQSGRHPCSFVAFSFGPRSCIGSKYAMLNLKLSLVTLIRRYRFYSDIKMKDVKLTFDMLLRSVHGYPVRLQKRHN